VATKQGLIWRVFTEVCKDGSRTRDRNYPRSLPFAACRLCAGSARIHANAPALTAIISSRPTRNPPAVAARTKALTPRSAPTCRMNGSAQGAATWTGRRSEPDWQLLARAREREHDARQRRVDGYSREVAVRSGASEASMINCWLVVALPMRATGTLFCTTTVSAGESNPMPAPDTSAATTTARPNPALVACYT